MQANNLVPPREAQKIAEALVRKARAKDSGADLSQCRIGVITSNAPDGDGHTATTYRVGAGDVLIVECVEALKASDAA